MNISRILTSSKIRIKLLIAFSLVVLIPLIAVGLYSIHSTTRALEKIALGSASEKVFLKAKKIEKFLNDARFDISFLSQSPTLGSLVNALDPRVDSKATFWQQRLEQEFLAFSQNKRIYYQIGFIDENGQEMVRVDSYGTLSWIANEDQLRNKKNQPHFVEALALPADQVFVSDMSLGGGDMQTHGLLVIEYAVPVLDKNSDKKGVVFTSISAENLLDIVKEEKAPTGGETFLIDKNGRYLSYPERIKQWGEITNVQTSDGITEDYPAKIVSQFLSGTPGTITEATDAIISFTPIFPKIGKREDFWVLVNVELKKALFSSVVSYRKVFAIVVIIALLAALGLSIGLAHHLTTPLVKLRDGANLIGQGNLKHRLNIRTGDEIQQLADEFNKMAGALHKSYSNLEAKVLEKTAELQKAYNQLQSQQEELKSAYEQLQTTHQQLLQSEKLSSIGRLAAGVAHEINNPIGVISMFIQILLEEKRKRGETESTELDKLKMIETQAEQVSEITRNLLEFSRQSEPHLQPIDVNPAIDEILAVIEPQVSKQKLKVMQNFQSPLPQVMADKGQLKQVFMNVILNACDAMSDGGELTIATATKLKKAPNGELGDFVEIRFTDTGCGISEEHLGKVFEPFFSTKGPGEGTGLGLAVSYGIVKSHKGNFEVKSEEGVGTTFIISLPAL